MILINCLKYSRFSLSLLHIKRIYNNFSISIYLYTLLYLNQSGPNFVLKTWGRIERIWAVAQIWLVPLKIVFNFSRFKQALNWNRIWADLRHGSNLLNSDSWKLYGWSKLKNSIFKSFLCLSNYSIQNGTLVW